MSRKSRKARSTRFIVDNSVWARLATTPEVKRAFQAIVDAYRPAAIMICSPVAAEVGFSARSGNDHTALMTALAASPDCPVAPSAIETLDIQYKLWRSCLVRSVGATDTLIAAYAIANDATVLHFDSDFEYVARVIPSFKHEWIVPRGSI